jgi:hypothetical protein
MMIDIKKEYTTLSGLPVRIYHIEKEVHGAFFERENWWICSWDLKGDHPASDLPLIEKKKVTEVGIGVFMDQGEFECATFHNETYFKSHCAQHEYTEIEFFTKQYEI